MLFHFSEESSIRIFRPRKALSISDHPSVVWAIDEEHAPHYFFPRDCPRVICWPQESTTREDLTNFFSYTSVKKIAAVESRWLERIRNTQLYVYTMPTQLFRLQCPGAGYYTSDVDVEPIRVEPVGDLLLRLMESEIELRITPSLLPLRDKVISSSLNFSIIRFANAVS